MHILIVGGGLVGSTLAEKLSSDGHDVSLIDGDPAKVRELADQVGVESLYELRSWREGSPCRGSDTLEPGERKWATHVPLRQIEVRANQIVIF